MSEFLVYNSDYSSGYTSAQVEVTNYSITSADGFQVTNDTLTSTGGSSSTLAVCSSGETNNALTSAFGPTVLAGCYDNATAGVLGNGASVNYTNQFTSGSALGATGYVEIVYDYSNGIPEPGTMALIGGGLIALSLVKRRRVKSDRK